MKLSVVLMICCATAWGQDIKSSGRPVPMPRYQVQYPSQKQAPTPLKCGGKHPHDELVREGDRCGCEGEKARIFFSLVYEPPAICSKGKWKIDPAYIDEQKYAEGQRVHTVTEKEWQDMVARLKALEAKLKCYGVPCFTKQ